MLLCNRQDSLDDAVGYHAEERFWLLPEQLVKQFDNAVGAIGALRLPRACSAFSHAACHPASL
jgi:hypothetical protein